MMNLSGTLMWLARNRPQEARDGLLAAMRPWEGLGFRTQHFTSLASHVQIDLYCGDIRSACRRLELEWPLLRRSMLLEIEAIRIFMVHLRGCCAVAAAQCELDSGSSVRLARRCFRQLAREKAPWGLALGQLIRASLADLKGDRHHAVALLSVAASHLDEARMGLYSAAARYRQGQLLGGDVGRALIAKSQAWMTAHKICDELATVNMYLPGFRVNTGTLQ